MRQMVGFAWIVLSLLFLPVFGEQQCAEGFHEQRFGHRKHCYRVIAYNETALQNGKSQLEAGDEHCKNLANYATDHGVVPRLLSVGSEEELRFIDTLFRQARERSCSAVKCAESLPLGVLSSFGKESVASFSSLDGSDVAFLTGRLSETSIPAGKCIFYIPFYGIDMANCGGEEQTPIDGSGKLSKSAPTRLLFAGCKYPLVGKRKQIRLRAGKIDAPKPGIGSAGSTDDSAKSKPGSNSGAPKVEDEKSKKPPGEGPAVLAGAITGRKAGDKEQNKSQSENPSAAADANKGTERKGDGNTTAGGKEEEKQITPTEKKEEGKTTAGGKKEEKQITPTEKEEGKKTTEGKKEGTQITSTEKKEEGKKTTEGKKEGTQITSLGKKEEGKKTTEGKKEGTQIIPTGKKTTEGKKEEKQITPKGKEKEGKRTTEGKKEGKQKMITSETQPKDQKLNASIDGSKLGSDKVATTKANTTAGKDEAAASEKNSTRRHKGRKDSANITGSGDVVKMSNATRSFEERSTGSNGSGAVSDEPPSTAAENVNPVAQVAPQVPSTPKSKKKKGASAVHVSLLSALSVVVPFIVHPIQ